MKPLDAGTGAYLRGGQNTRACRVVGCTFDEADAPSLTTRQWFIELKQAAKGWSIIGCRFYRRFQLDSTVKAILVGENTGGAKACVGITIINPMIQTAFTPAAAPMQIETRNSTEQTEAVIIGGFLETVIGGTSTVMPLDILDGSRLTTWIGNRRWRLPQILSSENPPTAVRGDFVNHLNRGIEAWNGESTFAAWIPLTVNRYTNATDVPATSRSIGTIVWETSTNKLKVFTGSVWNEIPLVV